MEPPSPLKWRFDDAYAKLKQRGVKFDIEKMERRSAGWRNFATRTKQTGDSQTKTTVNLESRNPREVNQENRKAGDFALS